MRRAAVLWNSIEDATNGNSCNGKLVSRIPGEQQWVTVPGWHAQFSARPFGEHIGGLRSSHTGIAHRLGNNWYKRHQIMSIKRMIAIPVLAFAVFQHISPHSSDLNHMKLGKKILILHWPACQRHQLRSPHSAGADLQMLNAKKFQNGASAKWCIEIEDLLCWLDRIQPRRSLWGLSFQEFRHLRMSFSDNETS